MLIILLGEHNFFLAYSSITLRAKINSKLSSVMICYVTKLPRPQCHIV